MSDRLVRFPRSSWPEIEALPEPLRWTVQRAIFHLLDEPVPAQEDVTIWYTVATHEGQNIISVQHVRVDT